MQVSKSRCSQVTNRMFNDCICLPAFSPSCGSFTYLKGASSPPVAGVHSPQVGKKEKLLSHSKHKLKCSSYNSFSPRVRIKSKVCPGSETQVNLQNTRACAQEEPSRSDLLSSTLDHGPLRPRVGQKREATRVRPEGLRRQK